MSELGYLRQPHTSAGRIPSDRGYRYYVDRLMSAEHPSSTKNAALRGGRSTRSNPIDEIVQETCRLLSEITHYPSLATPPTLDQTTLHRVFVTAEIGRAHV